MNCLSLRFRLFACTALLAACSADIDPSSTRTAASLVNPDEGFAHGFYLPLNDELIVDSGGVQVTANGNVSLSFARSTFEGAVDPATGEVQDYDAHLGLDGAVTIELAVDGGGALAGQIDLFTVPLPTFEPAPGIVVSPYVGVRLVLTGTADAGARVSMVAPFRVGTAFAKGGPSSGQLSEQPRFSPEIGLPDIAGDFEGTLELEVTTTFLTSIQGFPIGGPAVGTKFGAALTVDTAASTFAVDGLGKIEGAWVFLDPLTGLPDLPDELRTIRRLPRWNISSGALPNLLAPTRWSQVYDVVNSDKSAAATLAGGELVIVESGDEPWLASLDQNGVPRWQTTGIGTWTPNAIVRAQDGDLVVAGVESGGDDIRVERTDRNGAPVWRTSLTIAGAEVTCSAILPTGTNGVIVAGQVEYTAGAERPVFVALDASGAIQWSTEVDMGAGATSPSVSALAQLPSGEILAVGSVDYADGTGAIDGDNALILRLDAQGNPLAANAVGATDGQTAQRVAVHDDGSYSIGGDLDVFAGPHDVWLASFRADDSLRWSASYQSRPDVDGNGEQAAATGIVPTERGHGLLVSGHTGSSDQDAWLLRVDDEGMPIWLKTYRTDDTDDLVGVLPLDDGLIAFGNTGFTESNSSYTDIWAIRANVDGMVPFSAGNGFDAENTAAQWQRLDGHASFPLAPQIAASSTVAGTTTAFSVDPAAAIGELLTN